MLGFTKIPTLKAGCQIIYTTRDFLNVLRGASVCYLRNTDNALLKVYGNVGRSRVARPSVE